MDGDRSKLPLVELAVPRNEKGGGGEGKKKKRKDLHVKLILKNISVQISNERKRDRIQIFQRKFRLPQLQG
jgi:hypothetical protein